MSLPARIHPRAEVHALATVEDGAAIGARTRVWRGAHVMAHAAIGDDCVVGQGCFVGPKVVIGDRVRIQNHVSVFEGVQIEDDVFVGPSAVFTNVKYPRSFIDRKHCYARTLIRRGATVGANATILPGVSLGEYSFVGAGATVADDVAPFALVVGVPARQVGWVGRCGKPLTFDASGRARCDESGERYRLVKGIVSLEMPP